MKEKLKNFWDKHGEAIKTGAVMLFVGFCWGAASELRNSVELAKKIPYEPDYADVNAWIADNPGEAAKLFDPVLSEDDIERILENGPEEVNE